jgi:long-chain acyl-CoA synthetase
MTDEAIHDAVEAAIDEANTKQARIRRVKKFVILDTPLTIERGELTPTLKVKRKIVREHFADEIEQMYD